MEKTDFNEHLPHFLFTAFVLCCFTAGLVTQQFAFLFVPFVPLIAFIVLFKPALVFPIFLLTFYLGFPLIHRTMFGIFAADFIFVLLSAAFFSILFKSSGLSFRLSPTTRRITYILVLFIIVSFFSVLFNIQSKNGTDIIISVLYIVNMLQLVIVLLICSHEEVSSSREQSINLVLFLSVIEVLVASLQYFRTGYGTLENMKVVTGTFFSHHAMLGNMMVFPLAFCIYRMIVAGNAFKKACYFAGIFLSLYGIVISAARSTLVGCAFSIVLWLFLSFRISRRHIATLMAVCAVVAGLVLFSPLKRVVADTVAGNPETALDASSFGRILIWKGAVQQFCEAPLINKLFGIGIGNYFTMKYPFMLGEGTRMASGAHNNFLHVIIETGIAGLAVFVLLFGSILYALKERSHSDKLCFAYFYATLVLIFSGLTQETFWFQPSFCRLWLMYMIFLAFCLGKEPVERSATVAF